MLFKGSDCLSKKIKIYLPFMENEFKTCLAYRGSFYLFILCNLFGPFISYYLWMAIYGSSKDGILGGFTKNEMVVYIFMTYITGRMVMVGVSEFINDHVKEGSVIMYLIKPINYRASLIWTAVGNMFYQFFAPVIFVWIGIEIYKCFVLSMGVTSISNILLYLLSLIMSFAIFVLFDFCFGMIAFVTTYMFGMMLVKEAVVSFLCGQMIPISFFPEIFQKVFMFMPFSSMVYTPVMIYMGKYNNDELIFAIGIQFIWIIILYLLGSFLWSRIIKRLIVLGG